MTITQTAPKPGGRLGDLNDRSNPKRWTREGVQARNDEAHAHASERLAERHQMTDEQRALMDQQYADRQRDRLAVILAQDAEIDRSASRPTETRRIPRTQGRTTRPARTNTSRRTSAMAGSASSSGGGDDSGGEPPHDPAPLGAEGRATGSLSNPERSPLTVTELHRAEYLRIRQRIRVLTDLGAYPVGRATDSGWIS